MSFQEILRLVRTNELNITTTVETLVAHNIDINEFETFIATLSQIDTHDAKHLFEQLSSREKDLTFINKENKEVLTEIFTSGKLPKSESNTQLKPLGRT